MRRKKKRSMKVVMSCLVVISISIGLLLYQQIETVPLPDIDSKNGILINLETDKVMGSKNANKKVYPASLTKIMSAYVVIQRLNDLDQLVPVSGESIDRAVADGAAMAGFFRDEEVPARELLYGTLLSSGAEATESLGIYVAGSEKKFVDLMNQEAKKLGMSNTHFNNMTGLHQRSHYSTVSDIATLLKTALKNDVFLSIFTSKEHVYLGDYHPEGLYLASTLFSHLPESQALSGELNGGKTGFTEEAGQCLASLATINGQRYILVTAGASGTPLTEARHIEDALTVYRSLEKTPD